MMVGAVAARVALVSLLPVAVACGAAAVGPEMTLQSGEVMSGFRLRFITHDHNWEPPFDPVRLRISDAETRDFDRSTLRAVRVEEIERDERGAVTRLHVVFTTDDGEIRGWSAPLGVFAFQLYLSPQRPLSEEALGWLVCSRARLSPQLRSARPRRRAMDPRAAGADRLALAAGRRHGRGAGHGSLGADLSNGGGPENAQKQAFGSTREVRGGRVSPPGAPGARPHYTGKSRRRQQR